MLNFCLIRASSVVVYTAFTLISNYPVVPYHFYTALLIFNLSCALYLQALYFVATFYHLFIGLEGFCLTGAHRLILRLQWYCAPLWCPNVLLIVRIATLILLNMGSQYFWMLFVQFMLAISECSIHGYIHKNCSLDTQLSTYYSEYLFNPTHSKYKCNFSSKFWFFIVLWIALLSLLGH